MYAQQSDAGKQRSRGLPATMAAGTLLFLVGLSVAWLTVGTNVALSGDVIHDNGRRDLSWAMPGGGCKVTYAKVADKPIPPTWQASTPGSGSRMTWSLVEALTGIRTNDDYNSHERGYERVVAVKTHYPIKDAHGKWAELDETYDFSRGMVLLRNPLEAIPSYFNLQYEHQHEIPHHTTRGPKEDWLKYRDDVNVGVFAQLQNFERFVNYWMGKYPDRTKQLLLISYEDLTHDKRGPITATRIANFLGESEGVKPILPESIPCVWATVVKYDKGVAFNSYSSHVPLNEARRMQAMNSAPRNEGVVDTNTVDSNEIASRRKLQGVDRALVNQNDIASGRDLYLQRQLPWLSRKEETDNSESYLQRQLVWFKKKEETTNSQAMDELMAAYDRNVENSEEVQVLGKTFANPSSLRTGGPRGFRPYTDEMLGEMTAMFQRLEAKYSHDEDLVRILQSYTVTVHKQSLKGQMSLLVRWFGYTP